MKKVKTTKADLVTIKVTKETVKKLNMAAALSEKNQYEVAEEGSNLVHKKYLLKVKTN